MLNLNDIPAPTSGTATLPDTPAGRRFGEIMALIRNATPRAIAAYVEAHYTPANAGRQPISRRIGTYMDWQARGGMEVVELQETVPLRIEAIVQQPYSEERWQVTVEVEAAVPHRVETLLVGRTALPVLAPPSDDQSAADAIADYAEKLAARDLFSGAVLVAHHGEVLAQRAVGLANRDFGIPNTLETRFNVASLTKSWTGVAIAQLVEAGVLSFEDTVAKYIAYPDAQSAERIRIKHLLSHTGGLLSYFTEELDRTARHHIRTVDDYLALSKDQKPAFEAGSRWQYSNTGMVLLGKIIEIVTGQTYFDYVERNVLAPAGMSRSGFLYYDQVNENLAVGYGKTWSLDGPTVVNSLYENFVGGCPAGCGCATVGDVFRFAEALKAGKLVSPAMTELLTTAKPELNSPDYGYGFGIHPQRALYGHSGGLLGVSANLDIVEAPAGWVIVILANDLGMRPVVLKSRQLIGVTVQEAETARAYLPRAGMTAR
ncbi:MAG: beta-lactamase family protein [Burkholderiales bacterium]|nr:beta-lactamase family protein [Burkholderiales bacterium]